MVATISSCPPSFISRHTDIFAHQSLTGNEERCRVNALGKNRNTMKWKELENFKLQTLLLSQYRFLVLSPHLNHFRPVEATANKFPDINKSRNRIPSFFYQILPGNDGGNPCEDDRSDTSVSDPWERCLDSGLKLGVGRESKGELLLLSTCLSHTTLPTPSLLIIHNI